MAVRLHREDLDKLLELVERYQLAGTKQPYSDAAGTQSQSPNVLPPDYGIWLENRKFWEANLRTASNGDWSDEHYAEAADLLNAAEYQRIVFSEFADTLAKGVLNAAGPHFSPADSDPALTFVETVSVINATTGEHQELSLSPSLVGVPGAMAPDPSIYDGLWSANAGRHGSLADDSASLARLSDRPIDLSLLPALRGRDGIPTALNVVRTELFAQTGVTALRPYGGWDDFQKRNDLPEAVMEDIKAAYPDGFEKLDLWIGGLAEQPIVGDLGATLVAALHSDLESVGSTELTALNLIQASGLGPLIEVRSVSDIVIDPTHLMSDLAGLDTDEMAIILGTEGDDVVRGTARPEIIFGGPGDDTLYGGGGNDTIYGGSGNDNLYGGDGNDLLFGGAGDDRLDGGRGADVMIGGTGNDTYVVDDPNDIVREAAGEGNDTVKTTLTTYVLSDNVENLIAIGNQPMFVGIGNDGDNLIEGVKGGDNTLYGMDGDDHLYGGDGDDHLYGGDGDDYLDGGNGYNYLYGGAGNDTMRGSRRPDPDPAPPDLSIEGNDLLIATRRSDTFVLREGFGHDVVIDFDADSSGKGGRDRIDVSAYLTFDKNSIGTDILITSVGNGTLISIGTDTLTLIGIEANDIEANNFIFR